MQLTFDDIASPEAFCGTLKAAREQKGVALEAIAHATKISLGLLTALERGDLRHWPKGIFRRSFFRDYARAIGLPIEASLEAFRRFFPDDSESPAPVTAAGTSAVPAVAPPLPLPSGAAPDAEGLRLMLASAPLVPLTGWRRFLIALADAVIERAMALKVRLGAPALDTPVALATSAAEAQPPMVTQADAREWVSDARRVTNTSPGMRVRIRVTRQTRTRDVADSAAFRRLGLGVDDLARLSAGAREVQRRLRGSRTADNA